MDSTSYEIEIKRHALLQALKRGVTPDMIDSTIKGGTVQRSAKHTVKFTMAYKKCSVVCVGHIIGKRIVIFTVETTRGHYG